MTTDSAIAPAATEAAQLPLTESQKGLLVVDGMIPTPEIYNQTGRFDIDPAIPYATVVDAMHGLIVVQPALRQTFVRLPEVHAVLNPPPAREDLPLERVDATPETYEDEVAAAAARIGQEPFDLIDGPCYRFAYVRSTDGAEACILFCSHHIVGDGVSIQPIVRDLEAGLTGQRGGDAVEQLRLTREKAFARELKAQNRVSAGDQLVDRVKVWADRLREVPPLVIDPRPNRPAETAFAGGRVEWHLSEAENQAFRDTCKRLSVSPFVLFTSVYGAAVARHGAVPTVLVGSPFMARRTVGAFDLVGFFVNTLPVTVDVDWSRPFDEHATGPVRESVDFCRANVDIAFTQLVAQARPDRTNNRNPLFSCMLAMQDTVDVQPGGAVRGVREPGNGTAKFDLWLGCTPVDGRWLLELEYDRELVAPAVADGLLDSIRTALRRALADGSRPLADLFTDSSAAASLRVDGYPARVPEATLTEWLSASAERHPDTVAIDEPGGRMTYRELADAVERAAGGLTRAGTAAGDVVGLCVRSLREVTVAMLAILRCGAAYLPLDSSLPAERLEYMVRQAGCRLIVGDGGDLPGVVNHPLAELTAAVADAANHRGPAAPDAGRPAYVMYTSGSTGLPKGVLMGQGPLANLTAWQISALEMGAHTRFLQYAPLGFDVSFQEIVPTLAVGGTIVSREPADRRDFPALVRRVAETAVTHVYLPVAALRPFVQSALSRKTRFPALRYLCVSGEQLLTDPEIRRFFELHPHCVLVNLYGPTETHAVTTHRLVGAEPDWPLHVPIGLPIAGVAAYVVDATGHLAPTGVPGELCLGGVCPAEGYINDPERSAAGFVPDRFAGVYGAVMYRTGDLVLRDERGALIFLGRDDTQVKIRGYRIELGEIETVANALPGVRQAVAAARGTGADRELVLFIQPDGADPLDGAAVKEHIGRRLPAYMVPAHVLAVGTVPTTGTGKTDRDALLAQADDLLAASAAASAAAPTEYADDLERELAGIWDELLGVDGIPPDRPVLEFGAHSLNVFTALAQVQQRYGVMPPMVEFFRSPTITTLAGLIRAGQPGGPA
ncbi:non-ribosomal peptide synthetase [Dactylosporangium roseum]|uniref:non-ribosomal peptide synthetase n=1 Tax=Dactylosporangium roseum TaxID=47989 RepID=UPI0021B2D66E|nr:non-ribosomal peptide synthetase [Dactylosporangium roseum]